MQFSQHLPEGAATSASLVRFDFTCSDGKSGNTIFCFWGRGAELFKERSHPAGFLLRQTPPAELLKSYCERPQKLESEYFINPFRIQKEDETNTN